jgi:enoyl-CoA hydratase/carnithine racemase
MDVGTDTDTPDTPDTPDIQYEVDALVATVTLNRPEARNAVTFDMDDELQRVLRDADARPDVRAIVVTGAGAAFCAGDDVTAAWGDPRMETVMRELAGPNPPLTPLVEIMLALSTPTIAAVNGAAIGSGMDVALLCDIRLASTEARFAQAFVRMGLIADVTGLWLLPRIVGHARAAELLLTGAAVNADDALAMGLVSRVLPPAELLPAAHALATRIAANPPLATAAVKDGMRAAVGCRTDELDGIARIVGHGLHRLFATEDHAEAVRAFVERRPGVYTGQ